MLGGLSVEGTRDKKFDFSLLPLLEQFREKFHLNNDLSGESRWISFFKETEFPQVVAYKHYLLMKQVLQDHKSYYKELKVCQLDDKRLLILYSNPKTPGPRDEPCYKEVYVGTNTNFGTFHDLKLYIENLEQQENPRALAYENFDKPLERPSYLMDSDSKLFQSIIEHTMVHFSDGGNVQIEKEFDFDENLKKCTKHVHFYKNSLVTSVQGSAIDGSFMFNLVSRDSLSISCLVDSSQKTQLFISTADEWFQFLPNGKCLVKSVKGQQLTEHLVDLAVSLLT